MEDKPTAWQKLSFWPSSLLLLPPRAWLWPGSAFQFCPLCRCGIWHAHHFCLQSHCSVHLCRGQDRCEEVGQLFSTLQLQGRNRAEKKLEWGPEGRKYCKCQWMCYTVKEDQTASPKWGGQINRPGRKDLQGLDIFLKKLWTTAFKIMLWRGQLFLTCDDPYFGKKLVSGLFGADPWAFAGTI